MLKLGRMPALSEGNLPQVPVKRRKYENPIGAVAAFAASCFALPAYAAAIDYQRGAP
jgi:hypothetical protein